ncbi:hypothetical protein [Blastomonas sp.]|uniref:hypothetical protein n=1 Tax=Blastomonas sp. TaxID=1909299 RepID=UPI00391A9939
MSDPLHGPEAADDAVVEVPEPSLAEVSARRLAARSQWEKALARAKERFNPVNLRDEVVQTTADKIGGAADEAGAAAWAHRGKLAIAGLIGGIFLARKPIVEKGAPLAEHARASAEKAMTSLRRRFKN